MTTEIAGSTHLDLCDELSARSSGAGPIRPRRPGTLLSIRPVPRLSPPAVDWNAGPAHGEARTAQPELPWAPTPAGPEWPAGGRDRPRPDLSPDPPPDPFGPEPLPSAETDADLIPFDEADELQPDGLTADPADPAGRAVGQPDPQAWSTWLARLIVEVTQGRRPVGQLARWTEESVLASVVLRSRQLRTQSSPRYSQNSPDRRAAHPPRALPASCGLGAGPAADTRHRGGLGGHPGRALLGPGLPARGPGRTVAVHGGRFRTADPATGLACPRSGLPRVVPRSLRAMREDPPDSADAGPSVAHLELLARPARADGVAADPGVLVGLRCLLRRHAGGAVLAGGRVGALALTLRAEALGVQRRTRPDRHRLALVCRVVRACGVILRPRRPRRPRQRRHCSDRPGPRRCRRG